MQLIALDRKYLFFYFLLVITASDKSDVVRILAVIDCIGRPFTLPSVLFVAFVHSALW